MLVLNLLIVFYSGLLTRTWACSIFSLDYPWVAVSVLGLNLTCLCSKMLCTLQAWPVF